MSETIIDLAALRRLRDVIGGDSEDLAELIADFVTDTPTQLQSMQSAQSDNNWQQMRLAAHTLKSNARDLGATELSTLCASLEQACKQGEPTDIGAQVASIETALETARQELAGIRLEGI